MINKIKHTKITKTKKNFRLKKKRISTRVFANLAISNITTESAEINSVVDNISYHIKFTAASVPPNVTFDQVYYATALSVKERLVENWNATHMHFERNFPKETNYISMEFLNG